MSHIYPSIVKQDDISVWKSADSKTNVVEENIDLISLKRDTAVQPIDTKAIPFSSRVERRSGQEVEQQSKSMRAIRSQSAPLRDALKFVVRVEASKPLEGKARMDIEGGISVTPVRALARDKPLPTVEREAGTQTRIQTTMGALTDQPDKVPKMGQNTKLGIVRRKNNAQIPKISFRVNKLLPAQEISDFDDIVSLSSLETVEDSEGETLYQRQYKASLLRKIESKAQRASGWPEETSTQIKPRERKNYKSIDSLESGIHDLQDGRTMEEDAGTQVLSRCKAKHTSKRSSHAPRRPRLGDATALLFVGTEEPRRGSMHSLLDHLGSGRKQKQGRRNRTGM